MNANGGATIEGVLGPDDDMKGDDLSSDMSPGPGECGPASMISSLGSGEDFSPSQPV